MLTLWPGQSLTLNIGFDGSGTHAGSQGIENSKLCGRKIDLERIDVVESALAEEIWAEPWGPIWRAKLVRFVRITRLRLASLLIREWKAQAASSGKAA